MVLLIKNISQLVTCSNKENIPKKGIAQSDIGLLTNQNIISDKGKIKFLGGHSALKKYLSVKKIKNISEIDASGKTVMPGFVDSHTHFVFAGSRANEYEMRIKGSTYEEIAKAGGGIISTVKAVRSSSEKKLKDIANKRLYNFVKHGTTTLEGKSGYGLDTENEIKLLKVINSLNEMNDYGLDIVPTFLGAHSIPPGMAKKDYVDLICFEMIPLIAKKKLAKQIDIFCEKNYFDAADTLRILSEGVRFGMIPKVHTDQFNSIGGIGVAVKLNAASVDHLEVLKDKDIRMLSNKNIIANLLPGVSYFLDISYPPAKKLIENGVPVALATDFNPGSCMTENLQMIMSLASLKLKMSAEEIINAVTINASFALFMQDKVGSIETGKQSDILIFDFPSYKDLLYHFAVNQLQYVVKKGKIIYKI